jgi:DNA-directed RNA polymerase II subunit RPB1
VAFIALTCWWLTQDRSIPIYDAGDHLETAFLFHDMIRSGNVLGPFNYESPYPPLGELVGTLAAFIGGVNVAAPIVGENLVFVPLLVLGCYQIGKLLFDARAGLLAAIFVLGSPLLIAQLHVFMLDAPETALVAIAVWLLLACEDFGNVGYAALAGVAVGAGMLVKVQFAQFVGGLILIVLLRGGWRNRRGLAAFVAVALVIAAPWYLNHLPQIATFTRDASPHEGVPVGDAPPTLTLTNFTWYFWNFLNSQFLVPLFALIVGGTVWFTVTLLRHRRETPDVRVDGAAAAVDPRAAPIGPQAAQIGPQAAPIAPQAAPIAPQAAPIGPQVAHTGLRAAPISNGPRAASAGSPATPAGPQLAPGPTGRGRFAVRLEFFAAAMLAWLVITLTPAHDIRYGMPMMPYLAVIATGWIVYLPRPARLLAIAVVVLGVSANTLSTTFGVGGTAQIMFVHPLPAGEEFADSIRFYSNEGFLVAGPRRDGDVPGLLEDLRRKGVRTATWSIEQSTAPDFSFEGLVPLMRIAGLTLSITRTPEFSKSPGVVTLIHEPVIAHAPATCTRLSDGTGVWVVRYDTAARKLALYCPYRHPQFYDPGGVG